MYNPGSGNYLTEEGYQVGQTLFPLHKTMLAIPNHLLVCHTFGNGFQDYSFLIMNFSRIDVRLTSL